MWTVFGIPVVLLIVLSIFKLAIQENRRPRPSGNQDMRDGPGVAHFVVPYLVLFGLIGALLDGVVGGVVGAVLAVVVGLLNKALYDAIA